MLKTPPRVVRPDNYIPDDRGDRRAPAKQQVVSPGSPSGQAVLFDRANSDEIIGEPRTAAFNHAVSYMPAEDFRSPFTMLLVAWISIWASSAAASNDLARLKRGDDVEVEIAGSWVRAKFVEKINDQMVMIQRTDLPFATPHGVQQMRLPKRIAEPGAAEAAKNWHLARPGAESSTVTARLLRSHRRQRRFVSRRWQGNYRSA